MSAKRTRSPTLGRGHRENPWQPVHPTEPEPVIASMTANRRAQVALLSLARTLKIARAALKAHRQRKDLEAL